MFGILAIIGFMLIAFGVAGFVGGGFAWLLFDFGFWKSFVVCGFVACAIICLLWLLFAKGGGIMGGG